MRITVVSDVCYPTVCDGVASIVTHLVRELTATGHVVQLVVPRGSEMEGVELVTLPAIPVAKSDGQTMPLFTVGMFRRVRRFEPDLILFVDPRFVATQVVFLFRLLFGRRKLVATFHTDNFQYMKILLGVPHRVSGWLHRIVFGNFRRVVSVSEYCRQLLVGVGLRNCDGIWSGGLDTRLFHPDKRREELRRQLLQPGEHAIALHVGRLSREKGISRLAPLFSAAADHGVRWVVVGDGDDRAGLEKAAEGMPVTFVGKQYGESIAEYYASADFFVFPSTTDTFGLVVTEAMASGIPALAIHHGAIPKIIRDGHDGLVVDADEDALLAGFMRLATDAPRRAAMGRCARLSLAGTGDWDTSVRELLAMIEHSPGRDAALAGRGDEVMW